MTKGFSGGSENLLGMVANNVSFGKEDEVVLGQRQLHGLVLQELFKKKHIFLSGSPTYKHNKFMLLQQ